MKAIFFFFYYSKLRIDVALGLHQTANPLNLKWRWYYFNSYQFKDHNRAKLK